MKAFLEPRAGDRDYVMISRNGRYLYAPHFHYNIEVLIVKRGKHTITCNGKQYVVQSGDIALFDCYDIHSYDADFGGENKDDCVVILPLDYATRYVQEKNDRTLTSPIVHNPKLAEGLLELIDRGLSKSLHEKSLLSAYTQLFFALLFPYLQFAPKREKDAANTLIHQILFYVNHHFTSPLTLSSIAKDLGYTEAHLSRTFHRYLRIGIPEFINNMRLAAVQRQLRHNPNKKLVDVVKECGFQSMQTYYRVKKSQQHK